MELNNHRVTQHESEFMQLGQIGLVEDGLVKLTPSANEEAKVLQAAREHFAEFAASKRVPPGDFQSNIHARPATVRAPPPMAAVARNATLPHVQEEKEKEGNDEVQAPKKQQQRSANVKPPPPIQRQDSHNDDDEEEEDSGINDPEEQEARRIQMEKQNKESAAKVREGANKPAEKKEAATPVNEKKRKDEDGDTSERDKKRQKLIAETTKDDIYSPPSPKKKQPINNDEKRNKQASPPKLREKQLFDNTQALDLNGQKDSFDGDAHRAQIFRAIRAKALARKISELSLEDLSDFWKRTKADALDILELVASKDDVVSATPVIGSAPPPPPPVNNGQVSFVSAFIQQALPRSVTFPHAGQKFSQVQVQDLKQLVTNFLNSRPKMTQKQFAESIGMPEPDFSNWMTTTRPCKKHLHAIYDKILELQKE